MTSWLEPLGAKARCPGPERRPWTAGRVEDPRMATTSSSVRAAGGSAEGHAPAARPPSRPVDCGRYRDRGGLSGQRWAPGHRPRCIGHNASALYWPP